MHPYTWFVTCLVCQKLFPVVRKVSCWWQEQWPSGKLYRPRSLNQMQNIGHLHSEIGPIESESIIFNAVVVRFKGCIQLAPLYNGKPLIGSLLASRTGIILSARTLSIRTLWNLMGNEIDSLVQGVGNMCAKFWSVSKSTVWRAVRLKFVSSYFIKSFFYINVSM
jgi:hypothetical protein